MRPRRRVALATCFLSLLLLPALAFSQSISTPYSTTTVGSGLQTGAWTGRLSDSQHGGIYVTVSSSDSLLGLVAPDIASVGSATLDVFLPNGSTDFQFAVHALEDTTGAFEVVLSAPGFTSLARTVTVVPPGLDVQGLGGLLNVVAPPDAFYGRVGVPNAGQTGLSPVQKARVGGPGIAVTFTVDTPAIAQLGTTSFSGAVLELLLPGGASNTPTSVAAGGIALDGFSAGTVLVSGTAPGLISLPSATRSVDVTPAGISWSSIPTEVGRGLRSSSFSFNLSGSAHGGTTVRVQSANPGSLLLSTGAGDVGADFVDIGIADGQFSGTLYAHGVESGNGLVVVNATAPGFSGAATAIDVVVPFVELRGVSTSLDTLDPVDSFYARIGLPNSTGQSVQAVQTVRPGGAGFDVTFVSSDSSVAVLTTQTATDDTVVVRLEAGSYNTPTSLGAGGVAVDGIAVGTTQISVSIPGFVPALNAFHDLQVTQPEIFLIGIPSTLGAGLQSSQFTARLGAAQHGGVTVHLEVDDPSIALLTATDGGVGSASLDIFVPNGTNDAKFYVMGLEDQAGQNVQVSASAPGFTPAMGTQPIAAPAYRLYSSSLSSTIDTIDPDDPFWVRVGTTTGSTLIVQKLRAGSPGIDVSVSVDDSSVARLVTLADSSATVVVRVEAGASNTPTTLAAGGVAFEGLAPGVTAVAPFIAGWTAVPPVARTVTVTAPTVSFVSGSARVGAGLRTIKYSARLSAGGHGGTTMRIESLDPSRVLVSNESDASGVAFVEVPVADGGTAVDLYLHGVEGALGLATLRASATGFVSDEMDAEVVQPAVDIQYLSASATTGAADDAFRCRVGLPSSTNASVQVLQPRRPGQAPLVVSLESSDASVVELVTLSSTAAFAAVEIAPGETSSPTTIASGGVAARAVGAGTSLVTASIPGFVQTGAAQRQVTVTNDGIALASVPLRLGAGLQSSTLAAVLSSPASAGQIFELTSTDSTALRFAPDASTPGSGVLALSLTNGQTVVPYRIQGVAGAAANVTLSAASNGLIGTVDLEVVAPALQIALLADSLDVVGFDDPFVVQLGVPDATASSLAQFQEVSAAGLPIPVTLLHSDPARGDFETASGRADSLVIHVAVGDFQTAATVQGGGVAFDPRLPGTTQVVASAPGFVSTAAGTQTLVLFGDPTDTEVPQRRVSLAQNAPNPFNPQTEIRFELPQRGPVRLTFHDLRGRTLATLLSEEMDAGTHRIVWDGRDARGQRVASGVYVYRLVAAGKTLERKATLVK